MYAEGIDFMFGSFNQWRRKLSLRALSVYETVGANREYRMQIIQKAVFRRWLQDKVVRRGWESSATLFGEMAMVRFLRNMGFKRVKMDPGMESFTCGVSWGSIPLPFKRKRFYLPRWAIIYSEVEKLGRKKSGNATFGELLSFYDTMNVYDAHQTNGDL